jgi:hypothetical protein
VCEAVWPEGGRKRFIAGWGKDVTYVSLRPKPPLPPPPGIGKRSKVVILPTSAELTPLSGVAAQGRPVYIGCNPCPSYVDWRAGMAIPLSGLC